MSLIAAASRLTLCRSKLPTMLSCSYASKTGSLSQKKTASGGAPPSSSLDAKKLDPPSNIFRIVDPKDLGPGAAKDKEYKNPEYFSYHTMSYAEMDIVMNKFRCPQPSSLKK